jgi:prevent-host-death family protein
MSLIKGVFLNRAGIKELKAKLSSYVDRVRNGEHIVITDHGEEVGIILPISKERRLIVSLISSGLAQWSGSKPVGALKVKIKGKPLSETILQERA